MKKLLFLLLLFTMLPMVAALPNQNSPRNISFNGDYGILNASHLELNGTKITDWSQVNGSSGSTITIQSADNYITVANGTTTNISANITTFDIRYVLLSTYNSAIATINAYLADLSTSNTTTNARVTAVNTTAVSALTGVGTVNTTATGAVTVNNAQYTNITALQAFRDSIYTNATLLQAFDAAIYTNVTTAQGDISTLQTFDSAIYVNVSALQTFRNAIYSNTTALQTFDAALYVNTTALQADLDALASLAQAKGATGSITGSNCLQNITITNTSISGQYTTCGSGSGGNTTGEIVAAVTGTYPNLDTDSTNDYTVGGTDVALADGGTGASLTDPNADRFLVWDDSAGTVTWATASTGLSWSAANAITVRSASTSQTGIAETATNAEVTAGTDTTRYIPPSALTSITKLGTIATGVWQGTAVADAYIASSSAWNGAVTGVSQLNTSKLNASASFGGDVSGTYSNLQLGTGVVSDTEVSSLSWSELNNYPTACAANQTITTLGDTITCSDVAISSAQLSDVSYILINSTLLNSTDSPATGEVLSYAGNGQFTWVADQTGGAGSGNLSMVSNGTPYFIPIVSNSTKLVSSNSSFTSNGNLLLSRNLLLRDYGSDGSILFNSGSAGGLYWVRASDRIRYACNAAGTGVCELYGGSLYFAGSNDPTLSLYSDSVNRSLSVANTGSQQAWFNVDNKIYIGGSATAASQALTVTGSANVTGDVFVSGDIKLQSAVPFYIWYHNETVWDCYNGTGTIYNRGNASLSC